MTPEVLAVIVAGVLLAALAVIWLPRLLVLIDREREERIRAEAWLEEFAAEGNWKRTRVANVLARREVGR